VSEPGASAGGRAGGKVILLGEHVVVYGRPAVAAGLPIGLRAEVLAGLGPLLEGDPGARDDVRPRELVRAAATLVGLDPGDVVVRVQSELPPGRGFGSSAALAVAVLRALAAHAGRTLAHAEELELGRQLEAVFHGTPSGIDPAAAALGGCFHFVRGEPPTVTPVRLARPLPLVIAFDDSERSTGEVVAALRARREAAPERYDALFDAVAAVVEEGVAAASSGNLPELGRAFDRNQALLETLGVSSTDTDRAVRAARRAGALGAKLTGGGAGGAIIALAPDAEPVVAALTALGKQTRTVRVGEGVSSTATSAGPPESPADPPIDESPEPR
jgi:mevalonate kinase